VDCFHISVASVGQNHALVFLIVGFVMLRQVPWLIAAFRVAITQGDDDRAKRAREALDAIEPRWHLIWQKRS
jgi:hypothetical protein